MVTNNVPPLKRLFYPKKDDVSYDFITLYNIFPMRISSKGLLLAVAMLFMFTQAQAQESAIEGAKSKAEAAKQQVELVFDYEIPTYEVKGTSASLEQGKANAFSVLIPNADAKDAGKKWKKFMKQYKGKVSGEITELKTEEVKIKTISKDDITVYTQMVIQGTDVETIAAFDLGEGNFLGIDDNKAKVGIVQGMLNDFALMFEEDRVKDELSANEKELKGLNGNLNKLEKAKKKAEDAIAKYKQLIIENEEAILVNEGDQAEAKKLIDAQEKVVGFSQKKVDLFKNLKKKK